MRLPATRSLVVIVVVALVCTAAVIGLLGQPPHAATEHVSSVETAEQHVRALLPAYDNDVDEATLIRYLADAPGYRRHPSYYSDKYLRRGPVLTVSEAEDLHEEWGSWKLVDPKRASRPDNDFYASFPNRDVPWASFPADTAWQKDATYLPQFLDEGLALVDRALEAILTEYGLGAAQDGRPFDERRMLIGADNVETLPGGRPGMGARLLGKSYDGLVRRILHAVVTEDSFNFVMGGHSSAAAHGNHFQQSYTLAYGAITEPIFARLGVFASARNFGVGGLGTLQAGMAIGALYGDDIDVLMWDSGMTEKGAAIGVFGTQGLIGGKRVPLFITDTHGAGYVNQLHLEADVDAGLAGDGEALVTQANTLEELNALPWSVQYLGCGGEIKDACRANKYRGKCWFDRSDFHWMGLNMSFTPDWKQIAEPTGRASWHYGDRVHQKIGRALAGLVLNGLRDALLVWKNSTNYELADDSWHVTDYYANIRTKLTTTFQDQAAVYCQQAKISELFCKVPIQSKTEFTGRYRPEVNTVRSLMVASGTPLQGPPSAYDPPDVWNPNLHPPEGSVDVLAIVENGIPFTPNPGRILRRNALGPTNPFVPSVGSSVNPDISVGQGWYLGVKNVGNTMCDGEYDSWCNRGRNEPCVLYAHNDGRGGLHFDSLSGWGIFKLPNVREGLIVIKVHDWIYEIDATPHTAGWCHPNNDPPCESRERALVVADQEREHRELKQPPPPFCDDFRFEFAIDGKITSWNTTDWKAHMVNAQRVVQLATLLEDPNHTQGQTKDVELAMRLLGCGRVKNFALTHIYWA